MHKSRSSKGCGLIAGRECDSAMSSAAAAQYELTQTRAFTRWMNANLTKSGLVVNDLTDLQDGLVLVALLEQLTGKVGPAIFFCFLASLGY
jgi:hypothetical protein